MLQSPIDSIREIPKLSGADAQQALAAGPNNGRRRPVRSRHRSTSSLRTVFYAGTPTLDPALVHSPSSQSILTSSSKFRPDDDTKSPHWYQRGANTPKKKVAEYSEGELNPNFASKSMGIGGKLRKSISTASLAQQMPDVDFVPSNPLPRSSISRQRRSCSSSAVLSPSTSYSKMPRRRRLSDREHLSELQKLRVTQWAQDAALASPPLYENALGLNLDPQQEFLSPYSRHDNESMEELVASAKRQEKLLSILEKEGTLRTPPPPSPPPREVEDIPQMAHPYSSESVKVKTVSPVQETRSSLESPTKQPVPRSNEFPFVAPLDIVDPDVQASRSQLYLRRAARRAKRVEDLSDVTRLQKKDRVSRTSYDTPITPAEALSSMFLDTPSFGVSPTVSAASSPLQSPALQQTGARSAFYTDDQGGQEVARAIGLDPEYTPYLEENSARYLRETSSHNSKTLAVHSQPSPRPQPTSTIVGMGKKQSSNTDTNFRDRWHNVFSKSKSYDESQDQPLRSPGRRKKKSHLPLSPPPIDTLPSTPAVSLSAPPVSSAPRSLRRISSLLSYHM